MKKCNRCNRTYSDESFSFCLVDGSVLSAPYDPEDTLVLPSPPAAQAAPKTIDIDERISAFISEVYQHLYGSQQWDEVAKKNKLNELEKEFYSCVTPYTGPEDAMLRFLEKKRLA